MGHFSRKRVKEPLSVCNVQGIHIRPATNIYLLVEDYPDTSVTFSFRGRVAHASNVNEILALSAGYLDEIEV